MTEITEQTLLEEISDYIKEFFLQNIDDEYVFHDLEHTQTVVESVQEIGEGFDLTDEDREILQIAAWFHDTGYNDGPLGHEERSAKIMEAYLQGRQYADEKIAKIRTCILATKVPQQPQTLLEGIICDADLSHLGKKIYWDRCGKIRQELTITRNVVMSEQEWVDFELNFILQHRYHTSVAASLYEKRKQKNIRQLYKQKSRLNPNSGVLIPAKPGGNKKKKKTTSSDPNSELSALNLGRGVETMYRTTYRTHTNLSSIADNKANIMLSINAIIISIVVSTLVTSFDTNPKLVVPTIILLTVCLTSVVFATLSTRPKVTEGKFTREDIEQKRSNLLFFGNYYNMELEDFHWGMMEMIRNSDFLYSSMTRDLYFLGKVLSKKYRYLSICYSIFMYGLIGSVIAFAIAFLAPAA